MGFLLHYGLYLLVSYQYISACRGPLFFFLLFLRLAVLSSRQAGIMAPIRGLSLNVNGLKSRSKRRAIFMLIRDGRYDFALLQETHCTPDLAPIWQAEWGGQVYSSHGSSNSRGVLTLIPKNSSLEILETSKDEQGRFLLLHIQKEGTPYAIGNVYAPTQDNVQEQIQLIDLIEEQVSNLQPQNIILGGDFNAILDPRLDKSPRAGRAVTQDGSAYRARLESLNDSLELIDLWRALHPSTRQYSFRRANYGSRLDFWLISSHLQDTKTTANITPFFHYHLLRTPGERKGTWLVAI